MSVEQVLNYQLNKYPWIKKGVKRCYQLVMYTISPKIKRFGDFYKVSPNDNAEYFFGYYDKSPWDGSGRYMLCIKATDTWSEPDPLDEADVLLIDTQNGNSVRKVASTHTWNVQQGCMAQWLGSDYQNRIIYNDVRSGKYCSIILNIDSGEEQELPIPVYSVSSDGKFALSLDFSRLHNLRPGYGYATLDEKTKGEALPDAPCIWSLEIESGKVKELLKYSDFAFFEPRLEMQGEKVVHKVNHLMISPNGKRFMVLYRFFVGQRKFTRLITCNVDGTDMYLLSDDDMVSHCYWKNDEEIIAYERKKDGGNGYYLMYDKTTEYRRLWPQLSNDGHPSYCPTDKNLVVFDTYPNRSRVQEIKIARDDSEEVKTIVKVFAPFKYDNETRCDLHPRWSRDGKKVCFDSVYEGHRGLYVVNVE